MKPIYILWDGNFLFYEGPREALRMIGLPTLIPGVVRPNTATSAPPILTDDPQTSSLYENSAVGADIIAAVPPTEADWVRLEEILKRAEARSERIGRRIVEGP